VEYGGEGRDGVEPPLLKGSQEAHQDGLGFRTAAGAVSSARLAIHDGGPDRVLSRPLGGFDILPIHEHKQSFLIAPQGRP
jgi:hypothetical protein